MSNIFVLLPLLFILSCTSNSSSSVSAKSPLTISGQVNKKTTPPAVQDSSKNNFYPWKETYDINDLLINQILPPVGFKRTVVAANSYADWLRHLPLKQEGSPVHLYNGSLKGRQDVHAAVVDIDVGQSDLQQCADAVMRLRAEYWYSQKAYDKIHFNFTSGDLVSFEDWRQGRKPRVSGNQVKFSPKTEKTDNSYSNFKSYLKSIFMYAGTSSLSKELRKISLQDMEIGDVFILGGFPGHAVLIVDMVVNDKGEKSFLLAQSYMPAQNIHILKNFSDSSISPWYSANFGDILETPEWQFTKDQLRSH